MDASKYEQHVSAYKYNDLIVLNTNAKTEDGLWYLQEPFVSISATKDVKEIGALLVDMLGRSQTAVSNEEFTQDYLNQVFAKLLQAMGVDSIEDLVESANHCGVGMVDGMYEFTPTQKVETGELFKFLESEMLIVDESESVSKMGEVLLACFSACK